MRAKACNLAARTCGNPKLFVGMQNRNNEDPISFEDVEPKIARK